jgi:hypothetical protein
VVGISPWRMINNRDYIKSSHRAGLPSPAISRNVRTSSTPLNTCMTSCLFDMLNTTVFCHNDPCAGIVFNVSVQWFLWQKSHTPYQSIPRIKEGVPFRYHCNTFRSTFDPGWMWPVAVLSIVIVKANHFWISAYISYSAQLPGAIAHLQRHRSASEFLQDASDSQLP